MVKSKSKENKIFEELVEKRVSDINRYRNLINALIACYGYFNKKNDYNGYLGSQIANLSPDIIVKSKISTNTDIVGDGKKGLASLPKKEEQESWEDYQKRNDVKQYMEHTLEDINKDINKYSIKLSGISDPHDFFILCPTNKKSALGLLERNKQLNEKLIVLGFDFGFDETKYTLRIVKEKGSFSDSDINNDFELNSGIFHILQDASDLMSKYKLFLAEKEDYNAPIEWIMLVIWQYIIPEVANTNNKKMIIAQLTTGHTVVELTLKDISDFIKTNYTLPTYNGNKELISFRVIKRALEQLNLSTEVTLIEGERTANPKYRIIWKKISSQDVLREFVRKVNEKDFQKIAKEKAQEPDLPELIPSQTLLKGF